MYRTEYDFGEAAAGRLFSCTEIWGDAWVYVDGELLADPQHHAIAIELPQTLAGRHIVTVVLYQNNPGWTFGGIIDPIVIKR